MTLDGSCNSAKPDLARSVRLCVIVSMSKILKDANSGQQGSLKFSETKEVEAWGERGRVKPLKSSWVKMEFLTCSTGAAFRQPRLAVRPQPRVRQGGGDSRDGCR